jgi:DNA-binding winged helix-turn-helix (wHTH) protein/tetratricopeptide (TPR) repeat protein
VEFSPPSDRIVRFGVFEVDRQTGELRKSGLRVRLADQSLQVLILLLARPGHMVSREELAAALWPDGTNVDFENGVNAAVKKLRLALGDSGASPRYIETLPRRGYRLIVPVNVAADTTAKMSTGASADSRNFFRWHGTSGIATVFAVAAVAGALIFASKPSPDQPQRPASGWGRPSVNQEANGYFAKAQLFMGAGVFDPDRASRLFESALRLDPKFGKARAEYGFTRLIRIMLGYSNDPSELYEAEQEIRHGLRDDPSFSHGFTALAAVYLHSGRKQQALAEIDTALGINPEDFDARHWLAVYHWYSGDSTTARNLETETAARHPRFFPSRMTLGELARQEGDLDAAIREYERVLEYDPQNAFVLERLAQTYMDRADMTLARRMFDRLRPEDRRSYRTRAVEAVLLALEGKRAEAAAAMDAGVLKYIDLNALFTLTGAEFHAVMGMRGEALEWLERAVRQGDHRAEWFTRSPALEEIRQDRQFRLIQSSVGGQRLNQPK